MVTAVIGQDLYKTEITTTSNHVMFADEPTELSGGNTGPTPPEFLLISLASCTAITLKMYALRKAIQVDQIKVEVSSAKEFDITVFQRNIYITGTLTQAQRERLLEISELCPVHKIFTNPIQINTRLL